jgi:Flp pilus assembly protein TadG
MREISRYLRRLIIETRGAEIAESAAVLPLMFMILLGIFWFGQAFSLYGAITRAAQEGARAGAVPPCTTCGSVTNTIYATNAANAVRNALIASNLNPNWAQSLSPPAVTFCGPPVQFQCGSTGNVCVQLPVQLVTTLQGGGACGISVYFQYPFKFWLPFTSVNNQQILLTASARVRMETM